MTNWNKIIADNNQDDDKKGYQHLKFYSRYLRKTYNNEKDVNIYLWLIYININKNKNNNKYTDVISQKY